MASSVKSAPKSAAPKVVTPATSEAQETFHLVLNEMKPGDVFSEISHYIYEKKGTGGAYCFKNLKTGERVNLSGPYVEKFLVGADQYHKEVKVGKEDKKDGTPGIRTIFQNIYNSDVIMVAFRKQPEAIGPKKLESLRASQLTAAYEKLERASLNKKSMKAEAMRILKDLQENPIQEASQGELRVLRGYKVQFESRDGRYNCIDMDIPSNENQVRPVNINTIEWLIHKGVKYVVS